MKNEEANLDTLFFSLVNEKNYLNMSIHVINAQFEMVLHVNNMDHSQVEKLADKFDSWYKLDEWICHESSRTVFDAETQTKDNFHGDRCSSSDRSPTNIKSDKSDSGFGDLSLSLLSAPQTRFKGSIAVTECEIEDGREDFDKSVHQSPKSVHQSLVTQEEDDVKRLLETNLEAFLTFTGFPGEYKSMIIEKFMNSGMAIL